MHQYVYFEYVCLSCKCEVGVFHVLFYYFVFLNIFYKFLFLLYAYIALYFYYCNLLPLLHLITLTIVVLFTLIRLWLTLVAFNCAI